MDNFVAGDQMIARSIRTQLAMIDKDPETTRSQLLLSTLTAMAAASAIQNERLRRAVIQFVAHKSQGV